MDLSLIIYIVLGVHFAVSLYFAIYVWIYYYRAVPHFIANLLFGSFMIIKILIENMRNQRESFY